MVLGELHTRYLPHAHRNPRKNLIIRKIKNNTLTGYDINFVKHEMVGCFTIGYVCKIPFIFNERFHRAGVDVGMLCSQ